MSTSSHPGRTFVALVAVLVLTLIGNLVAQRVLPTRTSDPFGRRAGYTAVFWLVGVFVAVLVVGGLALMGL